MSFIIDVFFINLGHDYLITSYCLCEMSWYIYAIYSVVGKLTGVKGTQPSSIHETNLYTLYSVLWLIYQCHIYAAAALGISYYLVLIPKLQPLDRLHLRMDK